MFENYYITKLLLLFISVKSQNNKRERDPEINRTENDRRHAPHQAPPSEGPGGTERKNNTIGKCRKGSKLCTDIGVKSDQNQTGLKILQER